MRKSSSGSSTGAFDSKRESEPLVTRNPPGARGTPGQRPSRGSGEKCPRNSARDFRSALQWQSRPKFCEGLSIRGVSRKSSKILRPNFARTPVSKVPRNSATDFRLGGATPNCLAVLRPTFDPSLDGKVVQIPATDFRDTLRHQSALQFCDGLSRRGPARKWLAILRGTFEMHRKWC